MKVSIKNKIISVGVLGLTIVFSSHVQASKCEGLPSHQEVQQALAKVKAEDNGGFGLHMWATLVDRSGKVCVVAISGEQYDSQWPGSRVISAQKANTANAFSLKGLALSTANLYSAVQPGGSLFGLQESNPVNTEDAYDGDHKKFGTAKDPMLGKRIGGVNVFGGGLALYNSKGEIVGGIGLSGDSSCADHNIAWKLRSALNLDYVPAGVSPTQDDQIIYDVTNGKSAKGFGHVECAGKEKMIAAKLPAVKKVK